MIIRGIFCRPYKSISLRGTSVTLVSRYGKWRTDEELPGLGMMITSDSPSILLLIAVVDEFDMMLLLLVVLLLLLITLTPSETTLKIRI